VSALTIHQLKIGLHEAAPPLWRRIQVPSEVSLGFLHDVIQKAFGWDDCDLHGFEDERSREWGPPNGLYYGYTDFTDEEEVSLGKVLRAQGAVLWHWHESGDYYWRHRIVVEEILPFEAGVRYPRCTGGRRGALLATDPDAFDAGAAFDAGELTLELSRLSVRAAGDRARSAAKGSLGEAAAGEAVVFPAITLPALAELAAAARDVPLVNDALRLAAWCAPGRQVTGKGVLRPAVAREAVEELRLWERDEELGIPELRAAILGGLRSAGDLPVLDAPWRFATGNGLIGIRSGRAVPGSGLPDPADCERLLACWQGSLEDALAEVDDSDDVLMFGVLGIIGEQFDGVVRTAIGRLYRLTGQEWLDIGSLMSSLASDGDRADLLAGIVLGNTTRLFKVLAEFGAAEVDWGRPQSTSRARLTALGRYGIRAILTGQGHVARIAGDLAGEDAVTLLSVLSYYEPEAFGAEAGGWLAGRDLSSAVSEVLGAALGADAGRAVQRVTAISLLTLAKPAGAALEILRSTALGGPDGSRQVAAGALANLDEPPPAFHESVGLWLLVDLLTAWSASSGSSLALEGYAAVFEALRSNADNLWRCDHPAVCDTLEAVATAIRDSDKTLAKRLRKSAYKARSARCGG
jgi:hypothetical protein